MTVQNLEQRLLMLEPQQLKHVYAHLLEVLEPESPLLITADDIKKKEAEDRSLLDAFFSQLDIPEEGSVGYKEPAVGFLVKIAETFPEYGNEIEASMAELNSEDVSLDIPTATALTPIILATAVALIRPYLKVDIKKVINDKDHSSSLEVHFNIQAKGINNVVEAVKELCANIKQL